LVEKECFWYFEKWDAMLRSTLRHSAE
jgi:hypothetical protein